MPQLLQRLACTLCLVWFLVLPQLLYAQGCLLVPVPLAQRTHQAALVVEARVASQQPERAPNGHIVTRHQLEVYKVFQGHLPAGPLSVLTPGGFLQQQGEVVSGSLVLQNGQQGLFFLEIDPNLPGEYRAYAGPQGFIEYNLTTLTASEPFGRYASIGGMLYSSLAAQTGTSYREIDLNTSLMAATQRLTQRTTAGPLAVTAPTISSFSPSAVTAGTSTSIDSSATGVLTITGSGFGATRGAGYVQFRNADNPGTDAAPNYTQPLASHYEGWSDTQIRVRVPSTSTSANASAGTGNFQVFENGGTSATSPSALIVTFNTLTLSYTNTGGSQAYRVHLYNSDGMGGYTLHYSPSFSSVPGASAADAQAAYETALQAWHCATSMNRTVGATTTIDVAIADGTNVVRFATANELPAGVLGVTNSHYSGCGASSTSVTNWQLTETDYSYAPVPYPGYTWNFTTNAPTSTQFDFQSVVLHELGHGEQLGHIISTTGVMNWSVSNGQAKRSLDANTDIAGAQNIIGYSTSATANDLCNQPAFVASSCPPAAASSPLPVVLTAFAARYQPGLGTYLSWTTASEAGSLAFVVESQDDLAVGTWQQIARVAAAGSSPTPHQYANLDARPLAGTRYFRLRQLDLNGRVAYSPVVAVTAVADLAAYPNPATGIVHLSGPLATGATARVRLLDATGRCVATATGPVGQAALDLPLAGVPAGLYVVEWDGDAGHAHLRLEVNF